MPKIGLKHRELLRVLKYDAATGRFTWRASMGPRGKAGCRAGSKTSCGYIAIRIHWNAYLAHRLAWFYSTGKWADGEIDHINGVRDDNRISNLREATRSQNRRNHAIHSNNTSGFPGVCFHGRIRKWQAYIGYNKRVHHLGYFATATAARDAYEAAAVDLFGKFKRSA